MHKKQEYYKPDINSEGQVSKIQVRVRFADPFIHTDLALYQTHLITSFAFLTLCLMHKHLLVTGLF